MQVVHQQDHITHAVIGGKQAIDFGISSSAEFFNILSSTLYKDQILAVVREVLCNAWDAHIEAGCTDRAIEVLLSKDKLVIKDYGKGIHNDDMGPIYGVYGNSTKKNDGKQTGGFGLGCKAPFAYTDHFEVISCHDGVKTIYNLSKSSAQVHGKPGIIPIASFPTDDTGIQVTIRIKEIDHQRFNTLIKRIVSNGDMNATLNGEALPTLEFDTAKGNYLLCRNIAVLDSSNWKIAIRYGNVIYPVEESKEISSYYLRITQHLSKLKHDFKLIFQAPPHSISVTPSRESLSMQEHTVNTLNMLFKGYLGMLDSSFTQECTKQAKQAVDLAVKEERVHTLLCQYHSMPVVDVMNLPNKVNTLEDVAKCFMVHNYPTTTSFVKEDISYRLEKLIEAKLIDKGKASTFLRELKGYIGLNYPKGSKTWLKKRVILPVINKLKNAGMDYLRLYVCDTEEQSIKYHDLDLPIANALRARPKNLLSTLPYLRNIVVVASAKTNLLDRAYKHEVFKKLGNQTGFLFYHAGLKKDEKENAVKFFKDLGMVVVDLTFRQSYEPVPEVRVSANKKPKAKKGVVTLKSLLEEDKAIEFSNRNYDEAEYTETPNFIALGHKNRTWSNSVEQFSEKTSVLIARIFGSEGGIAFTKPIYDKYREKGVPRIQDYLVSKVCEYLLNSPTYKEYLSSDMDKIIDLCNKENYSLIEVLFTHPLLTNLFSISRTLTKEDKEYLAIYKELDRYYSYCISPDSKNLMFRVRDYTNNIPLNKACLSLIKKFNKSKAIGFISSVHLTKGLNGNKEEVNAAIELIKYVLK